MKTSNSIFLLYLSLLVGIVALSLSALFVRWADAPPSVMAFYRIGLATLILTPFALKHTNGRPWFSWGILVFPLLAGVFSALDHTVWNISLGLTRAANAGLLNSSAPLWVALVAWIIFREPLPGIFWIGLLLTLLGASGVLGASFLSQPTMGWGDLLALVSGVFYAGYFLCTQKGRQRLDTLPYVWLAGGFSTLTLLVISLGTRQPLFGFSTQTYLAFLGAALISQIGGYLALAYALGRLPASVVSPTMIAQPVLTALLAVPLLGEGLSLPQVLGGLTALAGIYLVHSSRQGQILQQEATLS